MLAKVEGIKKEVVSLMSQSISLTHGGLDNKRIGIDKFSNEKSGEPDKSEEKLESLKPDKEEPGSTPLHKAIKQNNHELIKQLLKIGADINVKTSLDNTPFHFAARYGDLQTFDLILEHIKEQGRLQEFINLPAPGYHGYTPLLYAIDNNTPSQSEIVDALIGKGADPNAQTTNPGNTPLHLAARDGNLRIINMLLDHVKRTNSDKLNEFINASAKDNFTPLHSAAQNGHLEVVKALIEKGANVDIKTSFDSTPLCFAALCGHLDIVKFLIENGADINDRDKDSKTPLHIAAENGYLDTVKYLIAKEADLNIKDNDGRTLLHLAVQNGHLGVVEYLTDEKGADFNVKNNDGFTPLHSAVQNDHLEVVKYLTDKKGADFHVKSNDGFTPLHLAAQNGHLEVVKYLTDEKGADFNVKNNDGFTPLHLAAQNDKLDAVQFLVDKGTDVNAIDKDGKAPILFAPHGGNLNTVQYLVDKGADINTKDKYDRTPLYMAAEGGNLEVIQYLIEKGASYQGKKSVWFNVREPVVSFVGRDYELKSLHNALQSGGGQVVISQMASISGLAGVGKSELARKYAYGYRQYYNNVIWVNAETQESIRESFKELAKELKIPVIEEKVKKTQERDTRSIVDDVYKHFRSIKSLFIFDNAEEYKDINEFLPLSFSLSPDDEKPYVLITSRNQRWRDYVGLLSLDALTEEEAIRFTKKALNIKDNLQDKGIEELAHTLQCYPLALQQAASYIKERNAKLALVGKKFEINDYLIEYKREAEELLDFESNRTGDRYIETVSVTWKVTIENIKQKKYGPEALNILEIMAYLTPDKVPIERFFSKLIVDEEKLWNAVELLNQYSMINVEQGTLSIHRLVQQIIRLGLQDQGKEEEILSKALKLTSGADIAEESFNHVVSTWSYASKYGKLIDNFCFNSIYGKKGNTPLHLLASNGNSEVMEDILIHIKKITQIN